MFLRTLVSFHICLVRQNIAFGLKMQVVEKEKQDKIVDEIMELMRLKPLEHGRPANLSGGEKQKVALVRALAINSKLVLLDEPLASVDSETAQQLRNELKDTKNTARQWLILLIV